MNFKTYLIVGFSYLKELLRLAVFATFIHFLYNISKTHALIILVLALTSVVTSYSIELVSRDYLYELYAKLYKEQNDRKEEER